MNFQVNIHGLTLSRQGAGMHLQIGDSATALSGAQFNELVDALKLMRKMTKLGGDAAPAAQATVAPVIAATPVAAATPATPAPIATPAATAAAPASAHVGPTKRGPKQSAGRAGHRNDPAPRSAEAPAAPSSHPAKLTQRGKQRERGALVRLMIEWFEKNPGDRELDEVVEAAEQGHWTQAVSVKPAVIAALRRSRSKVQRNADGTFALVTAAKKPLPPGRVVRRQRRR